MSPRLLLSDSRGRNVLYDAQVKRKYIRMVYESVMSNGRFYCVLNVRVDDREIVKWRGYLKGESVAVVPGSKREMLSLALNSRPLPLLVTSSAPGKGALLSLCSLEGSERGNRTINYQRHENRPSTMQSPSLPVSLAVSLSPTSRFSTLIGFGQPHHWSAVFHAHGGGSQDLQDSSASVLGEVRNRR